MFVEHLRPQDRALWLEVFYAGGTATRDFSSADLVAEMAAGGANAEFAPSLTELARAILLELRG